MKKIVAILFCTLALVAFLASGVFAGDEKPVKPEKPAKCEPAPAQGCKKSCDPTKPGCDPAKCQGHAKGETPTKDKGHAGCCSKPCAPAKDAGAAAAKGNQAAPDQTGTAKKSK